MLSIGGFPGAVQAFSLGELQLLSSPGQPFQATAAIKLGKEEEITSVTVGSTDDYALLNLPHTAAVEKLTAQVKDQSGGPVVWLQSTAPIQEEDFFILLRVSSNQHTFFPFFRLHSSSAVAKKEPVKKESARKEPVDGESQAPPKKDKPQKQASSEEASAKSTATDSPVAQEGQRAPVEEGKPIDKATLEKLPFFSMAEKAVDTLKNQPADLKKASGTPEAAPTTPGAERAALAAEKPEAAPAKSQTAEAKKASRPPTKKTAAPPQDAPASSTEPATAASTAESVVAEAQPSETKKSSRPAPKKTATPQDAPADTAKPATATPATESVAAEPQPSEAKKSSRPAPKKTAPSQDAAADSGAAATHAAESVAAEPQPAEKKASRPPAKKTAASPQGEAVSSAAASTPASLAQGGHYGPVKEGESLSEIVSQMHLAHDNISFFQAVVGLWRQNPGHFIRNNMNGLKSGVTLTIPSSAELAQVDLQEARQLRLTHGLEWQKASADQHDMPAAPRIATATAAPPTAGAGAPPTRDTVALPPSPDKQASSVGEHAELGAILTQLQVITRVLESNQAQQDRLEQRLSSLEQAKQEWDFLRERIKQLEQARETASQTLAADPAPRPPVAESPAPPPPPASPLSLVTMVKQGELLWLGAALVGVLIVFGLLFSWLGRRWNQADRWKSLQALLSATAKQDPQLLRDALQQSEPSFGQEFMPATTSQKLEGVSPSIHKRVVTGDVAEAASKLKSMGG
ncbi:MAG: hypothetical protein HQL88_03240 [Magnetococcales bacterium]|nr:hypothetical protein [Magnetococcales bacterium]